jgi:DNA invertase Pin-like site-specific DNA recombinase
MSKQFFYARVSSKEQNLSRQLDTAKALGIDGRDIFTDKQSGKDFNRSGYLALRQCLRAGDVLFVKSIDRLGRDYREIIDVWQEIVAEGVDIVVADMPLLDTRQYRDLLGTFISDLVLQVLSFVSQQERDFIRSRQAEGIASAHKQGKKFGRPNAVMPEGFMSVYADWKQEKLTAVAAYAKLGMTKSTFYKFVSQVEGSISKA